MPMKNEIAHSSRFKLIGYIHTYMHTDYYPPWEYIKAGSVSRLLVAMEPDLVNNTLSLRKLLGSVRVPPVAVNSSILARNSCKEHLIFDFCSQEVLRNAITWKVKHIS